MKNPVVSHMKKKCEGRGCFIRSENTGLKKPTSVCSSPVKLIMQMGDLKNATTPY